MRSSESDHFYEFENTFELDIYIIMFIVALINQSDDWMIFSVGI